MTTRILITAGPTREAIDPVRFLSNASSGRQAVALAEEALSRGWVVDMVHGPMEAKPPAGAALYPVVSASEMLDACRLVHPSCDVLIGAAAVSDYRPQEPLSRKHARGPGPWTLVLVPTQDILAELGKQKGSKVHVGFALETEDLLENASRKLLEKNLDLLVANPVSAVNAASSQYLLLSRDGSSHDFGTLTKRDLARILCEEIECLLRYRPVAR